MKDMEELKSKKAETEMNVTKFRETIPKGTKHLDKALKKELKNFLDKQFRPGELTELVDRTKGSANFLEMFFKNPKINTDTNALIFQQKRMMLQKFIDFSKDKKGIRVKGPEEVTFNVKIESLKRFDSYKKQGSQPVPFTSNFSIRL